MKRRDLALAAAAVGAAGWGPCAGQSGDAFPSLAGASGWLNSPPLSAEALRGQVVLVDFWTYTCINWRRELPYVRAWARKYRSQGLVVIGVHSPEFSFEKDIDKVRRAVATMGIDHPVAVDSDHAVWRAFGNAYWPALYFIDGRGRVRHRHHGEGDYDKSERVLQQLLRENGARDVAGDLATVVAEGPEAAADWQNLRSPEAYAGHGRSANFASPGGAVPDRSHTYRAPERLRLNHWALVGDWEMRREAAVLAQAGGRVAHRFHARDLHLVMGPSRGGAPPRFRITLDGRPPGDAAGVDGDGRGYGTVAEHRMYQLIRQPGPIVERHFEIEFLDRGAEVFAFTFG